MDNAFLVNRSELFDLNYGLIFGGSSRIFTVAFAQKTLSCSVLPI